VKSADVQGKRFKEDRRNKGMNQNKRKRNEMIRSKCRIRIKSEDKYRRGQRLKTIKEQWPY
jgi:predicted oxidoreductase